MARPVWKGHISFGLINIPVTLYSAEQRSDLHFRMLDSRNMAKVRYERVNEETGEEVPWNEIVKAFEYDSGNYVVLDDDDFKKVAVEATQTVDLEGFVDQGAIDYVYFDKPYYLVPGKKAEKGYVLLRETLRRTNKVGIARVVIRARQYLAALLAEGDALVLNLLRYHQELRNPAEYELPGRNLKDYKVNPKEIDMAEQLVESMTVDWQPEQYQDEYRHALMKWIEKKARMGRKGATGKAQPAEAEETGSAEIIDMMELLKKSMKKGEKERTSGVSAKKKSQTASKRKRKSSGNRRKAS
jgi:DNA end-binding protein Ku